MLRNWDARRPQTEKISSPHLSSCTCRPTWQTTDVTIREKNVVTLAMRRGHARPPEESLLASVFVTQVGLVLVRLVAGSVEAQPETGPISYMAIIVFDFL